jgi:hypothetical protein
MKAVVAFLHATLCDRSSINYLYAKLAESFAGILIVSEARRRKKVQRQ